MAFIDYKKAFDSIDRDALWKVLEHFGIKGNMLATPKAIYIAKWGVMFEVKGEYNFFVQVVLNRAVFWAQYYFLT